MTDIDKNQPLCISVFRNGKNSTSKPQFTKKWIEMINKIEKSKANCLIK